MKRISTLFSISFVLLSFAVSSQGTMVEVILSNNAFSPQHITINVGDTVRWINAQGSHNINGGLASYPDNPEPIFMGTVSTGWEHTHVFSVPGFYEYHCDLHVGMGMTGSVTVEGVTSILESSSAGYSVSAFPIPAEDMVTFDLRDVPTEVLNESELVIYSATGKRQKQLAVFNADQLEVNVTDLPGGLYLFQLTARDGQVVHSGKFLAR